MAANDFLDNLARLSSGRKAMLLFLPMLLAGALYWQGCYVSADERLSSFESQRGSLLDEQTRLDEDLAMKKLLQQRREELQQSILANQRALPTAAELPAFFDFLQRRAGEAGISIRKWEQMPSEKVDIYVRVPVKIEVTGSFLGLAKYFYLLGPVGTESGRERAGGTRGAGERIVSVENLYLGDAKVDDGEVKLMARFVAATFYLDDGSQGSRKAR